MAIQGIQNPTVLAQPTAQTPDASSALGRDAFMKLLVAQLRNQDPLDPLDARDFVTQLSQLTGVEELTKIGDRMGQLEVAMVGVSNTQTSDLVGKQVKAKGDTVLLSDIGGTSSVASLSAPASSVTVRIQDQSGKTVRTLTFPETKVGDLKIAWDGNNDEGTRAQAGRYSLVVEAKDENGKAVDANTDVSGVVSSVSYEHGFPELVVGDRRVALGNVTSIGR